MINKVLRLALCMGFSISSNLMASHVDNEQGGDSLAGAHSTTRSSPVNWHLVIRLKPKSNMEDNVNPVISPQDPSTLPTRDCLQNFHNQYVAILEGKEIQIKDPQNLSHKVALSIDIEKVTTRVSPIEEVRDLPTAEPKLIINAEVDGHIIEEKVFLDLIRGRPELKHLEVIACRKPRWNRPWKRNELPEKILGKALGICPELTTLDLTGFLRGNFYLDQLRGKCPNLETLRLNTMQGVSTEYLLIAIKEFLPQSLILLDVAQSMKGISNLF